MKRLIILTLLLSWLFATDFSSQIATLEKRLQEQEKRLQFANKETSFTLGGRVQFDTVLNRPSVNANGGTNTYDYYLTPNSFSNNAKITKLSSNVKSSRLWFKTRRKTEFGILRSLVEVDFWGSNGNEKVTNSHNLRIRHAYLSLNNWTVGQTYSTFMGNSMPDLIILSGDVAFVRQPMLRYTLSSKPFYYDIALESPESILVPLDTNTSTAYNDDPFFDTVFRVRYEPKSLKFSLSGIVRPISKQHNNQLESKIAWGVNTSFKYLLANNDYLQASAATGEGIGRYLSLAFFPAGEFDTTTQQIELLPLSSGHISYTHRLSKKVRSTLLFSTIKTHATHEMHYIKPEQTSVAHANIRYTPFSQALISLEYAVGQRDGDSFARQKLHRLMASFAYIF